MGLHNPRRLLACVLLCYLSPPVFAWALHNVTLPLPQGTTNHGMPGLLCTPTQWSDTAAFYLLNYVAHAATVLVRPGERSADFVASVIGSLLFPALGLYRGIEAILSGAILVRGDDLRKAAKSGALCMVVRGADWRPADGLEFRGALFRQKREAGDSEQDIPGTGRKQNGLHLVPFSPPHLFSKFGCPVYVHRQVIHGTYTLPTGYRFAIVPSETLFHPLTSTVMELSAVHNFVKALVALAQTCFACATLYRSRGDQISQFGYAAFGLTVAPYAVMSTVNLLGNICRPEYASLYMMESSLMDEARARGGCFHGAVGRILEGKVLWESTVDGCERVEDVTFRENMEGAEGEKMIVTFNATRSPSFSHRLNGGKNPGEKTPTSLCSSRTKLTYPVYDIPAKFNYTKTSHDALLLIPCCPPLSLPSDLNLPQAYAIKSLSLCRTIAVSAHKMWCTRFSLPVNRYLRWRFTKYLITLLISLIPLMINGLMSRFQTGSIPSTESSTWRSYTTQWLVFGVFTGLWWVLDQEGKDASLYPKPHLNPAWRIVLYIISASSAVGGFIVTGQMLGRYGICTWVGD
ncbi:hypothetical protein BS50DRAFT_528888 [Corynespora cassiicola Philippines]|uniref:Uncharacterized protein n=1 Tax=Corynespora cassiicola Philippines TaxID=1448308 RepID=A0A2T2NGI7_CORCC|nr:hypothetical protein BS50DRAFT_528888 [Corynespora cassiicola Philippines]